MDREDRILELQQALAKLDRARWTRFLEAACPEDESLREEVLRRQQTLIDERPEDRPLACVTRS